MSWLTEPDSDWDSPDEEYQREPRSKVKLVALLLGAWLLVSVMVLLLLLVFGGHHSSPAGPTAAAGPGGSGSAGASSGQPSPSASASAPLPDGWVREAGDNQSNCAAHSYGQVQSFFAKTPCTSVHRELDTTNQAGRTIVIASNVVTFDTAAQAKRYLALVNADGTGNISDLLREGVTYPGAPRTLPDAAFASRLDNNRVLVAEAAYVTGASNVNDPTLRAVAQQAIR